MLNIKFQIIHFFLIQLLLPPIVDLDFLNNLFLLNLIIIPIIILIITLIITTLIFQFPKINFFNFSNYLLISYSLSAFISCHNYPIHAVISSFNYQFIFSPYSLIFFSVLQIKESVSILSLFFSFQIHLIAAYSTILSISFFAKPTRKLYCY